jgi:hypothetical protein
VIDQQRADLAAGEARMGGTVIGGQATERSRSCCGGGLHRIRGDRDVEHSSAE